MLDQLRDIVQGKPRFEITEIAGRYLEGRPPGGGASAFQPPARRLVDDLAEQPAGALRWQDELVALLRAWLLRKASGQASRSNHLLNLLFCNGNGKVPVGGGVAQAHRLAQRIRFRGGYYTLGGQNLD